MDLQRARKILETLADGVDPMTGEVLPEEHVCNRGDVVRAFHYILQKLSDQPEKKPPENAGKPWTTEDDAMLCRMYDTGSSKKELCAYFKRSTGESRRVWYGWGKLQRVMSLKNRRDQVPPSEFNQRRYFLIVFNLLLQQTEIPLEAICCIE